MRLIAILPFICVLVLPLTSASALEMVVELDDLLGFYDEGDILSVDLDLGLPVNAVVEQVALHLSGTANNGLYYDNNDPDQTMIPFWGDFTPYFLDTSPYVYGYINASSLFWAGHVTWNALGGDVHWEFLDDGVQSLSMQFIGPAWVGFPVIENPTSAVISTAELTVTYQPGVPNESSTWGAVKKTWR